MESFSILPVSCPAVPIYHYSLSATHPWIPDACGCLGFTYSKGYRVREMINCDGYLYVNIDSFKASGVVRIPLSRLDSTPSDCFAESVRMRCIVGAGNLFSVEKEGKKIVYFQDTKKGLLCVKPVTENFYFNTKEVNFPLGGSVRASCVLETKGGEILFTLSEKQEISWMFKDEPKIYNLSRRPSAILSLKGFLWVYSGQGWIEVYTLTDEGDLQMVSSLPRSGEEENKSENICRNKELLWLRIVNGQMMAYCGPFAAITELFEEEGMKKSEAKQLRAYCLF